MLIWYYSYFQILKIDITIVVLHQMPAVERQANLILGEDKIGFIFLDCRGNTPGGKSTSTAGPGTGQKTKKKQKTFNHFATVQEQLNDYSMPSWKLMKTLLFKGSQNGNNFFEAFPREPTGNGAVRTPILLLPPLSLPLSDSTGVFVPSVAPIYMRDQPPVIAPIDAYTNRFFPRNPLSRNVAI